MIFLVEQQVCILFLAIPSINLVSRYFAARVSVVNNDTLAGDLLQDVFAIPHSSTAKLLWQDSNIIIKGPLSPNIPSKTTLLYPFVGIQVDWVAMSSKFQLLLQLLTMIVVFFIIKIISLFRQKVCPYQCKIVLICYNYRNFIIVDCSLIFYIGSHTL